MTFQDLSLIEPILRAVAEKGYETPTPIQTQAIPVVLKGGDLLGIAQTGTGKTAAFSIPLIQQIVGNLSGDRRIKALVLTPTRELAIQIDDCIKQYAKHTKLRHAVIFGGVNQNPQVRQLAKGVDLLVATPGRLLDLIGQGHIKLDGIRHFVLDEADRMLDMGFVHDIKRILPLLPAERQTLFFSATMPDAIAALGRTMLRKPTKVEATPTSSVVDTIEQQLYRVEKTEKSALLVSVLNQAPDRTVLVFSRTKHGADRIARTLQKKGIGCHALHGNKTQGARQRALTEFKSGEVRVIVATDIAARGIDLDSLGMVINYDVPDVAETYVHRIGRTGRAGRTGTALTFCSADEYSVVRDIQKLTGKTIREAALPA